MTLSPEPVALDRPALFDTSVWTWVRDRRFPHLAEWFNGHITAGRVLICELVTLELLRASANERRVRDVAARLGAVPAIPMPVDVWDEACALQLALAANGDHRRVPPTDLLLAKAAAAAGVPLVHYDRDYERIAAVSELEQRWFVPDGALA